VELTWNDKITENLTFRMKEIISWPRVVVLLQNRHVNGMRSWSVIFSDRVGIFSNVNAS
jgi:hypothetical protein